MKIKNFLEDKFQYFLYFYNQLKYRIFLAIGLSILVGILDGFGLTMFLPLLQMVSGDSEGEQDLGNLEFIPELIQSVGLPFGLSSILIFLCVFFVLKGIAKFINESYNVIIQEYYTKNVRLDLVTGLNEMSYKTFVKTDLGKIQNTLTGEVGRLVNGYKAYFATMKQMALVIVYMSFAFFVDGKFALLVICGALLTNLLYRRLYQKTKGASKKMTKYSHKLQSFLLQLTHNFKYLKATGGLGTYEKKVNESIIRIESENRKIGMLNATLISVKEPVLIIVVSGVILFQNKVLQEPLGPILISLLFFYRSLSSLMSIQNEWNKFISRVGSLNNMIEFKAYLINSKESKGAGTFESFKKEIHLKNVGFSYINETVLSSIDLSIKKNETIAFVGESGSGKTTLLNILSGLLPVENGEFYIDEVNIADYDISQWQSRIGYITQEPVIFNDSIFNNVTFWKEPTKVNIGKFNEALEKASISKYVNDLPDKGATVLGDNGVSLSGGQKQRISIARELFKDIDILVMDEATSALDSETEQAIQSNISNLKGHYTILIVAHRLSTIKDADRIVLLKNGKIEMEGSFDFLRKNSTSFNRMVEFQEF